MKTLAYALYVICVLLISGLAHANADSLFRSRFIQIPYQTPLTITKITPGANNLEFWVELTLPNSCYDKPLFLLTQDESNPSLLTLHVSAQIPTKDCVSRTEKLSVMLSLPTLISTSKVHIEHEGKYVMRSAGFDFEVQFSAQDVLF